MIGLYGVYLEGDDSQGVPLLLLVLAVLVSAVLAPVLSLVGAESKKIVEYSVSFVFLGMR